MIEKIRWDIIVLYIDVAFQDLTPNLRFHQPRLPALRIKDPGGQ